MLVSKDKLLFYLKQFKNLSFKEAFSILRMAKLRHVKANEVFICQGSTEQKLAYIKSGLVRSFIRKADGEECTILLRWEEQFIASHDNLIFNRPSRFYYQALEDTTLIEIDYHIIKKIMDSKPQIAGIHVSFLMDMLGEALDRVESFVLLNAEQRYLKLLKEKPNIYNRVADKYIATMLGITPVSLSRIRKRTIKSAY